MSIEFIGVDNHVWRIFPPTAYYSVDFERGWTAGIEISQGTILGSTPNWAENLYFRPPQCDRGGCVLGVPSSRGSVPLTLPDDWNNLGFQNSGVLVSLGNTITKNTKAVAIYDLNGDGFNDIILGNYGQPNQLFKNSGDGTFEEEVLVVEGATGQDNSLTNTIALGDINDDGWMDIIVGNDGQSDQFLVNMGNGIFQEITSVFPLHEASNTMSIAIADVNKDGLLDLIFGMYDSPNRLVINRGGNVTGFEDEEFDDDENYSFADTNQNGWVDLILESQELSDGGSWKTSVIAVADLDNDGWTDIIVGNTDRKNSIFRHVGQDEDGSWKTSGYYQQGIDLPGESSLETNAIAAADINHDGRVDVIVGSEQGNQLLLSNEDGSFQEYVLPGEDTKSVTIADIDGDGSLDIILGACGSDGAENAQWLRFQHNSTRNSADELFALPQSLPGDNGCTNAVAISDLHGLGRADAVIGNGIGSDSALARNAIDGNYVELTGGLPGGRLRTKALAVVDVNMNGWLDIIIANDGKGNQLLRNVGDGEYVASFETFPGSGGNQTATTSIAVADVDNDGWPDLVFGYLDGKNELLLNDGHGSFAVQVDALSDPSSSSRTRTIVAADVDLDGWMDGWT